MPIAAILFMLDVFFIVHAAKTGRFFPWAYVILLLPGIGVIAYALVEVLPELMGSPQSRQAKARLVKTLNPEKRYRQLTDDVAITDTIANRDALAQECLVLGRYQEAEAQFGEILTRPMGDDPKFAYGLARAQFGLGKASDSVATLDALRERWPDYQSADAHLLYARALEHADRWSEALDEYQALANYYPGAEARVRYAQLLDRCGRSTDARAVYLEIVTRLKRAPKYVRKVQAEWIAAAEKGLRQ